MMKLNLISTTLISACVLVPVASTAQECDIYKKVLLVEVVSYCLVERGIITPKEAFMLNEYHLLTEKEAKEARTETKPTIADMKEFIKKNGYCGDIYSDWKTSGYSLWCPKPSKTINPTPMSVNSDKRPK